MLFMTKINVVDRDTLEPVEEKVEAGWAIKLLYETHPRALGILRQILCRGSFFSKIVGWLAKTSYSKRKIQKFITHHNLDASLFLKDSFDSFNDFFIRKLKSEARPISQAPLVMPADGRYLAYENFRKANAIVVKDTKFSLLHLLGKDEKLTERYLDGPLVIARLAPCDYHRFHFPVSGVVKAPLEIQGAFHSVNPMALNHSIHYLAENKRVLMKMTTTDYGQVLCVAVGALFVGSIHTTYLPNQSVQKGEEMGYFSFGGSTLILLFEPGKVEICEDLLAHTAEGIETLCRMGTPLCKGFYGKKIEKIR